MFFPSWCVKEPRTIPFDGKSLTRGKEPPVQFPSHLLKNTLGLHPKPKLPPNRNVLRGLIGLPMSKKLVLNHRTLRSRVAQASEQGSPVNPQQPPRLRPRLRITSDLGRPLHERFRGSPSPPRSSNSALPNDRPRMPINPDSIFNNHGDTNHGVNTVHGSDSAFMRAASSSSVEVQPTAGDIAARTIQNPSLVEPPGIADNMIQQFIAGHNMANEMRAQHRQQVRNDRAGGTRTPS